VAKQAVACLREAHAGGGVGGERQIGSLGGTAFRAVKNAAKILLGSVGYFNILLKGISGIFVNNLPLSS